MNPDQETNLIKEMTALRVKLETVIDNIIPRMEENHTKLIDIVISHGQDISYGKAIISIIALLLTAFGGTLLAHILGGK